jgi:hypothetical protein
MRDPQALALIAQVLATIQKTELSSKDVVRVLLSVAASKAVHSHSFEDCVEFEDAAHDFYHTAMEVLEPTPPPHTGGLLQ